MAKIRVNREGRTVTFSAEAPAGQKWKANDAHEVVYQVWKGNKAWEREGRQALLDDIALGTYPCEDRGGNCDWCDGF